MVIKILIAGSAALAAIAPVAAVASSGPADADGFYASQAITSGRLDEAERVLRPASYEDAADPARLINIATVYAQTNRQDEARLALERVKQLPDEELTLQNGVAYSSRALASAMIGRLGIEVARAK